MKAHDEVSEPIDEVLTAELVRRLGDPFPVARQTDD